MKINRMAQGSAYVATIEDVICEIRQADKEARENGLRIANVSAFIQPELEFGIPREHRPARYHVSISLEDQPPVLIKGEEPPKKKGWWA